MSFTAERISRSATINIASPIEKVFPLFGPVREKEWAYGWDPQRIYPPNAMMEEHMVFVTKSTNAHESLFTWMITQLQENDYLIEYTVSTSNRIWTIRVVCKPAGEATSVTITYAYTGLNKLGNELNANALEEMYADSLKDWEKALNHYLKTGEVLKVLNH